MKHYLGIDLGGTNLVVGVVDEERRIVTSESIKTHAPRPAESICDDIAAIAERLLAELQLAREDIAWAGLGSPGVIHSGVVVYASNLGFDDVPLGRLLQERLGIPVLLENDANAAAYGEFLAGAGRGYQSLTMLTIGTGIGGGIIADSRIWSGFNGAAGELGHIVIEMGGRRCPCGKDGCLEAYCSASSLRKLTQEAMERDKGSLMWELCGGEIDTASAKTPFRAAEQGDEAAKGVVEGFLYALSLGVSNAINLLQPQVFVLGGGVSREGETILAPLRELVKKQTYLKTDEQRPKIVQAELGSEAGLIGAALLGLQKSR